MNKIKYITFAFTLSAIALTSCEEDAPGTTPGNDSEPHIIVNNYAPGDEYEGDTDRRFRVTTNNKVNEVYYLVEPKENAEAYKNQNGEQAYIDKVLAEGKKVDIGGNEDKDIVVTGLKGKYLISFVGVNGGQRFLASAEFFGQSWETIAKGVYKSDILSNDKYQSENDTIFYKRGIEVELQHSLDTPEKYRFHNVYGKNANLVFTKTEEKGVDEDGVNITYIIVESGTTPLKTKKLNIQYNDIATWRNDAEYMQDDVLGAWIADDNSYFYAALRYYIVTEAGAAELGHKPADTWEINEE